MARQRTDSYWVEWVRSVVANEPGITLAALANRAAAEGNRRGRDDYPSERTIRRIRDDYRQLPAAEQVGYQEVYWPESFVRGDLPWEAAPVVLELHREWASSFRKGNREGKPPRLATRHAQWLWRITLANPALPVYLRLYLVLGIMAEEHLKDWKERDRPSRVVEQLIMDGGGKHGLEFFKELSSTGLFELLATGFYEMLREAEAGARTGGTAHAPETPRP